MTPTAEYRFREHVANMPTAQANRLRDSVLTPERKELIDKFRMFEIAAMIACVVAGALFALIPNLFVVAAAALIVYSAFEIHTVSSNVKKTFEDFTIEAKSSKDQEALLAQVSKGTCFARYIIPLYW